MELDTDHVTHKICPLYFMKSSFLPKYKIIATLPGDAITAAQPLAFGEVTEP